MARQIRRVGIDTGAIGDVVGEFAASPWVRRRHEAQSVAVRFHAADGVIELVPQSPLGAVLGATFEPLPAALGRLRKQSLHAALRMIRAPDYGPRIVPCQWNMSSPIGPAVAEEGGSVPRSWSSL